ncbi:MAG: hypothetical protein K2N30_04130, partial [Clostridia bacterium]|nr:hypothetical protein [Clostridia bacterium]
AYSDGERLKGEVAQKYFEACLKTLRLYGIDGQISKLQTQISAENDVETRKKLTGELQKLIVLKKQIKSGDRI